MSSKDFNNNKLEEYMEPFEKEEPPKELPVWAAWVAFISIFAGMLVLALVSS